MILHAIFLNLFPQVFSNVEINKFLSNLQSSDNLDSIYIFKINNSIFCDKILESITLPKITVQDGFGMNYLNLPRYQLFNSFKYYFNREFMTILIAEKIEYNFLHNELLKEIIWYSKDKIFVIITDRYFSNTLNLLEALQKEYFLNVIYIDVESFQYSKEFITFESFSYFKLKLETTFKKETVSNLQNFPVKVACIFQFPFSYCVERDGKDFGIGRMFHLITNFVSFLNGSLKLITEDGFERIDLWTKMKSATLNDTLRMFPLDCELFSRILENYDILIIIPKSKYIKGFLYVIKPFSLQLWLLCFVYLIYASAASGLAFYIIKKDIKFWTIFDHVLRAILSQSYPNPLPGFYMNIIYLLAMIMGFVMTIWYSTLLGSFFTTFIREPQILTLTELKESNVKIVPGGGFINTTTGFDQIKDSLILLPEFEKLLALTTANSSYAHLIPSTTWEVSLLLPNFTVIKEFYLERSHVRFMLPLYSIFKHRLDRFIDLVQDTGLYIYWKRQFYYESYIFEDQNRRFKKN